MNNFSLGLFLGVALLTASILAGTQAPQAMTAPRNKVRQQRRRSAKKPAKTRGFLQAGGDPRQALWHPPVSPYGLLEEVLYEDPWKLLVACMLLNVTSGMQVCVSDCSHTGKSSVDTLLQASGTTWTVLGLPALSEVELRSCLAVWDQGMVNVCAGAV